MDGIGREFLFERRAHRFANVLTIGSDVDAAVLHRFVLEVLRHPGLDQHMVIVRPHRSKQILHGFGRHLIIQARRTETSWVSSLKD